MIQLKPTNLMLSLLVNKEQVKRVIIKIMYTYFKHFILLYSHEQMLIWQLLKTLLL